MNSVPRATSFCPSIAGSSLLVTALAALFLIGCGPVQSTAGISQAEASIERARIHDADEYSPYEYERATHYLYKSKEEWGYSNFEISRNYAREARRAADAALDNAREAPWQGHPVYGFEGQPEDFDEVRERVEEADNLDDVDELDTP